MLSDLVSELLFDISLHNVNLLFVLDEDECRHDFYVEARDYVFLKVRVDQASLKTYAFIYINLEENDVMELCSHFLNNF